HILPGCRDLAKSTCDKLHKDATIHQLRHKCFHLAKAHKGVSAHQRKVKRLVLVHQAQDARHQVVALAVVQLAERYQTPQVFGFIGIAARASERALAGNLDGQGWSSASKDSPPSLQDIGALQEPLSPGFGSPSSIAKEVFPSVDQRLAQMKDRFLMRS